MAHKMALLPGDGIGPEVTVAAMQVLEALREVYGLDVKVEEGLIGGAAIDARGESFPAGTEVLVRQADAVLLGAVGGPQWDGAKDTPERGLLTLRQSLGLFANIRPFEVFEGLESQSPLKHPPRGGVIVRELLGGLYYGEPRGRSEGGDVEAFDTARYRTSAIERLARIGFHMAQSAHVALVSVDKANVLETSRLWRETVKNLHQREFSDVVLIHRYVDAAAMELVRCPELYEVVVTENLFGDILSDLTGGIVGSLGVLGSATLGEWPDGKGLYEPIHGSAPDIAGQGIANPVGAIWSLSLMLQWSLGEPQVGRAVQDAVRNTIRRGMRTPDLGGTHATADVTRAIIDYLYHGEQPSK